MARDSRRTARVGAALRNALGELLTSGIKDPRIQRAGVLGVTGVDVSPDLGLATVYVTTTEEDPGAREALLDGFAQAAPYLRAELAQRLSLRRMPELRFRLDPSIEHGRRIEAILQSLGEEGD